MGGGPPPPPGSGLRAVSFIHYVVTSLYINLSFQVVLLVLLPLPALVVPRLLLLPWAVVLLLPLAWVDLLLLLAWVALLLLLVWAVLLLPLVCVVRLVLLAPLALLVLLVCVALLVLLVPQWPPLRPPSQLLVATRLPRVRSRHSTGRSCPTLRSSFPSPPFSRVVSPAAHVGVF